MLEAVDLTCERGGRRLFEGLSFSLNRGDLLRIAGPNGSGKTSLLRMLCGLLPPSAGEVRWKGQTIDGLREEYARHIVYFGHAAGVKGDLTAAENLEISCRLSARPASPEEISRALTRFQVPLGPVRKLSQGEKRRAALARLCLSFAAPLWLFDEPFTALDAAGVDLMKSLIDGHVARGAIVVYTTHQDPGVGATRVVELR